MKVQSSFNNSKPTLYIVATPIGNLSEMTFRAIEILKNVDVIACEDTRTTMKLLSHYDIHTKVISHHAHNEQASKMGILDLLEDGKDVALVSDAGYPLISDPGQSLVSLVVRHGYNVVPVSGANAMLNALVASGICAMPFYFHGFLSSKDGAAKKELESLKNINCTMVFYESVHRIRRMLENVFEVFGECEVCVARELTKKYEEFIRGNLSEVIHAVDDLKGEFVVVINKKAPLEGAIDENMIIEMVNDLVSNGLSTTDAIKLVAKNLNVPKNDVYKVIH